MRPYVVFSRLNCARLFGRCFLNHHHAWDATSYRRCIELSDGPRNAKLATLSRRCALDRK